MYRLYRRTDVAMYRLYRGTDVPTVPVQTMLTVTECLTVEAGIYRVDVTESTVQGHAFGISTFALATCHLLELSRSRTSCL